MRVEIEDDLFGGCVFGGCIVRRLKVVICIGTERGGWLRCWCIWIEGRRWALCRGLLLVRGRALNR